ncbi:MAG: alpha amylase C-terminal domain-containing protein [Cytophagales bacterium]|nr:alpha amylase C-terminal domain-containing protein [Cytophaga sp.]
MSQPSLKLGMGATPYSDTNGSGTTFRVWLEHATMVWVSGTFNQWSPDQHALYPEGNGYWSADVQEATTLDRYRYVIQSPFIQGVQWRTDPYCKSVENNDTSDGGIVAANYDWGNDVFVSPPWNELVIYELHVASFNRSDTVPGTFDSIIEKLDYLKDLGINAIEIMPIFGFPGAYSLGYNPAFPFDIESNYGGPINFKDFIKAAHQKGFVIIMDIVLNHFGPDDLDSSLWRSDGWYENGKSGIYFYNDWRSDTGFGDRPDYGRPEVRQYLRDNVLMWIEEYRIDGLRFDSTVNIRNAKGRNNDPANDLPDGWSLLQWINTELNTRTPWKIAIAEDLQDNVWITRAPLAGGAGFNSQWDSSYYWNLFNVITSPYDENRNMKTVCDALLHNFDGDACKRIVFINNHDQCAAINNNVRLTDRIWMGHADNWIVRKRYTLAAALVFTSPGIPLIFQGDEFLEWGSWDPSGSLDWNKRTQFSGILSLFQSLIRLRRNWFNTTAGLTGQHVNAFHINNINKLIAYHRWANGGAGDDVIVVANFANTSYQSYTIGFPAGGNWHVRFNSDWNGFSNDFGDTAGYDTTAYYGPADGLPFSGNIGIGPYSVLILSQ